MIHNINFQQKKSWFIFDATRLLCAAFLMFSLWDFYYKGIGRIFDYIGIAFVLAEMSCAKLNINRLSSLVRNEKIRFYFFITAIIITFFSILSFYNDDNVGMAGLAIVIGLLIVFNRMLLAHIDLTRFAKFISFLIIINVIVFFLQFFAFKLTGHILDITGALGSISSRVYNHGLHEFRPAGLFQEPNSYCVNLFMLMVLRNCLKQAVNKCIMWAAFLTLLVSQSLWGAGAAIVWLLFFMTSFKRAVFVFLFFTVIFLTLWHAGCVDSFMHKSVMFHRATHLDQDSSRHARYGQLGNYFSWDYVFGFGVNTMQFQSVAANGLAFMIYSFGWIFFLFIMITLFSSFYVTHHTKTFVCVIFLLTTDQIMTYMIFWAWLALLLHISFVTYNNQLVKKRRSLL